jgi:hypothetical protein
MFTPDITLNTKTYSLTSQRTASSLRSDASQPVAEPRTITISHENVKSGRRNSVIILEDVVTINSGTTIANDSLKVMFKLSYNPFSGRTTTEADIAAFITELVEFINTPANVAKLLNQES